jgi:hypothetical protein
MATRGTITLKTKDGRFQSIYHHFDSYPKGLGKTLLENYTTYEDVEKIIALGACSNLGPTLDADESVFYHRDRQEDLHIHDSVTMRSAIYPNDFNYVFQDGQWSFFVRNNFNDIQPLTKDLVG